MSHCNEIGDGYYNIRNSAAGKCPPLMRKVRDSSPACTVFL